MIHAQLMKDSGVQVVNVHFAVDRDSTQWARLPRAPCPVPRAPPAIRTEYALLLCGRPSRPRSCSHSAANPWIRSAQGDPPLQRSNFLVLEPILGWHS